MKERQPEVDLVKALAKVGGSSLSIPVVHAGQEYQVEVTNLGQSSFQNWCTSLETGADSQPVLNIIIPIVVVPRPDNQAEVFQEKRKINDIQTWLDSDTDHHQFIRVQLRIDTINENLGSNQLRLVPRGEGKE